MADTTSIAISNPYHVLSDMTTTNNVIQKQTQKQTVKPRFFLFFWSSVPLFLFP